MLRVLIVKKIVSYRPSSIVMYYDASNITCDAYSIEIESKVFHKMLNDFESIQSSTWREMRAIEQALYSFKLQFSDKSSQWCTDNQNCLRIVQAGSMNEPLQSLAYSMFSICTKHSISIDIQWIPRKENTKADYISKIINHEDWGVPYIFFEFIDNIWGPHSVDRFASVDIKNISRFNSLFCKPSSEAIDALTQNWSGENNFLVPPIYSVVRAIKHLIYSKVIGTLMIPSWVSAPFWSFIFKKHMQYQNYVRDVLEFAECDRIYVKGSSPYCIFGTEKCVSPVLAVRLDAR